MFLAHTIEDLFVRWKEVGKGMGESPLKFLFFILNSRINLFTPSSSSSSHLHAGCSQAVSYPLQKTKAMCRKGILVCVLWVTCVHCQ